MEVGDRIESANFGWFIVTDIRGNSADILFEDSGNMLINAQVRSVRIGGVVDNTRTVERFIEGDIYNTTASGKIEILKVHSMKSVDIRFLESENILFNRQAYSIFAGMVSDKARHTKATADIRATAQKIVDHRMKLISINATIKRIHLEHKRRIAKEAAEIEFNSGMADKIKEYMSFRSKERNHPIFGKYVLTAKTGESSWNVHFLETGNNCIYGEKLIERNSVSDNKSDRLQEYRKLISKQGYEDNRETRIAQASQYQKDNLEKVVTFNANRRARRKKADGYHTLEEVQALAQSQNNLCNCCGSPLIKGNKHLDHIMPIILGGSNYISNLQYLCRFCNLSKNGSHPDEWAIYSESDVFLLALFNRLTEWHFENQDIL